MHVQLPPIPEAIDGLEVTGLFGRMFDFPPYVFDVRVDRAVEHRSFIAAHLRHDLASGERAMGMFHQKGENAKLGAGQFERLVFLAGQPSANVDEDVPAAQHPRLIAVGLHRTSSEHGFNACDQLLWAERLRHVIVRSALEPVKHALLVGFCRHHDEGDGVMLAQCGAHLLAGYVGQHQIEQDQRDGMARHDVQGLSALGRAQDGIALFFKVEGHKFGYFFLVFDDEDEIFGAHAVSESLFSDGLARQGRAGPSGEAWSMDRRLTILGFCEHNVKTARFW